MGRWGSKVLNVQRSFCFTCLYRILDNFEHYFLFPESPKSEKMCAVGGWGPLFRTKSKKLPLFLPLS